MQTIHTGVRRRGTTRRDSDKRYKDKINTFQSAKRLLIGELTFIEHHSSVTGNMEPRLYSFWGGLALTEKEIRERVS